MTGYTLTYDNWETEEDLWFSNSVDALRYARMMSAKPLPIGLPFYASVTVRRDSDGRRIFHCDNT